MKNSEKTRRPAADPAGHHPPSAQDERLYNEILDAILNRRLSPGLKLKEDELADIFSVSRTVVRRALLRLSHDRIVDIQPNRGATIVRPDPQLAREVLAARRLIEGAVIREATRVCSTDMLDTLRRCVDEESHQLAGSNRHSGLRLSGDFHIRIAVLSGNSTLAGFLRELVPQTSLIISTFEIPGNAHCSHVEHREIIDAIASGDEVTAAARMDEHLQNIEAKLDLDSDRAADSLRAAFAHLGSVARG